MHKYSQATLVGPAFEALRAPTRREQFLSEMERVLPWQELGELIEPAYWSARNCRARPLELDRLLRIYFLQRWFGLTDSAVREEVYDSASMRSFACVGLNRDAVPAESTVLGFRQLLDEIGLGDVLVDTANRHLLTLGLSVSSGAIVDAALIRSQIPAGAALRARTAQPQECF